MFNKKHDTIQKQAMRLRKFEDQTPSAHHTALASDALAYVSEWIDTIAHETAVKSGSDVEAVMILQTLASDCRSASRAITRTTSGRGFVGNGNRFKRLIDGE